MLDEESSKLVTINTHKGLFRYARLPFGVASAPAVFQRTMDNGLQFTSTEFWQFQTAKLIESSTSFPLRITHHQMVQQSTCANCMRTVRWPHSCCSFAPYHIQSLECLPCFYKSKFMHPTGLAATSGGSQILK